LAVGSVLGGVGQRAHGAVQAPEPPARALKLVVGKSMHLESICQAQHSLLREFRHLGHL